MEKRNVVILPPAMCDVIDIKDFRKKKAFVRKKKPSCPTCERTKGVIPVIVKMLMGIVREISLGR